MNTSTRSQLTTPRQPRRKHAYEVKVVRTRRTPRVVLNSPTEVYQYWMDHIATSDWYQPDWEQVVSFNLDSNFNLISFSLLGIGTPTAVLLTPQNCFRSAVAESASHIIIAHNHPSGDSTPSKGDKITTSKLTTASELLHIPLAEHVIIGLDEYSAIVTPLHIRTPA